MHVEAVAAAPLAQPLLVTSALLGDPDAVLLVHCHMGVNRVPVVVPRQRVRDEERLREWRSGHGLDVHAVIRRIRTDEDNR